jgi:VanZ family protein
VSYRAQAVGRWTPRIAMRKRVLTLLCASVLVVTLTAGLWPFHAPKNGVSWLSDGLHFGNYGVILSPNAFSLAALEHGTSCSVEIWLQSANIEIGGTILAFYMPENRNVAFSVNQSLDDLLFQRETVERPRRAKTNWYIENAFRKNTQLFVTISANGQSTAVYLNGALARTSPSFGFSRKDLTGQLVLGSRPLVGDDWRGKFKGLAIYNRELTAAEVLHDYDAWTMNQPAEIKNENPVALYLFNEGVGNLAHNQMNSGDLHIPERYSVLDKTFLEPPLDEFDPSWGYCKNLLINIGGFVPLGFLFCAYFSSVRHLHRAVLATTVLGGVVSLAIEVLQAFLPTRNSGMTDIITNTLGTGIGAVSCSCESVQAVLATVGFGGQA